MAWAELTELRAAVKRPWSTIDGKVVAVLLAERDVLFTQLVEKEAWIEAKMVDVTDRLDQEVVAERNAAVVECARLRDEIGQLAEQTSALAESRERVEAERDEAVDQLAAAEADADRLASGYLSSDPGDMDKALAAHRERKAGRHG